MTPSAVNDLNMAAGLLSNEGRSTLYNKAKKAECPELKRNDLLLNNQGHKWLLLHLIGYSIILMDRLWAKGPPIYPPYYTFVFFLQVTTTTEPLQL